MAVLVLLLIIVALALGIVDEVLTRARSIPGWAIIALALALLIPLIHL